MGLSTQYTSFVTTLNNVTISSLVNSNADYISKNTQFSLLLNNLINPYSNLTTSSFEIYVMDSSNTVYEYLNSGLIVSALPG